MSLSDVAAPTLPKFYPWTDEQDVLIRNMIAAGAVGSELLAATGAPGLAWVYRRVERLGLRLNHRRSAERRITKQCFSGPRGVPVAPGVNELLAEPSDAAMSLADLDDTRCHWPISGAGLDMMFCGERADEETCGPYCGRHHRIAYRGYRNA